MVESIDDAIDVTPDGDGGVLKRIIKASDYTDYKACIGDNVHVHYVGMLQSTGKVFDASRKRGNAPFEFKLKQGMVIKGWDIGVATMNVGETAIFTINSKYGYGTKGSPPSIPGDSILIFQIELIKFTPQDVSPKEDGSVTLSILAKGEGIDRPNQFADVTIKFKAFYPLQSTTTEVEVTNAIDDKEECNSVDILKDDVIINTVHHRKFDERQVSYTVGEGLLWNLPPALDHAIIKMSVKQRGRITLNSSLLPSSLYFSSDEKSGEDSKRVRIIPSSVSNIVYELELMEFTRCKENWQLNGDQKLEECVRLKQKGTEIFKRGDSFGVALNYYKKIVECLDSDFSFKAPSRMTKAAGDDSVAQRRAEDEKENNKQSLLLAARLNCAMCYLKMDEWLDAKKICDTILSKDGKVVKALFRRGEALLHLNEHEAAKQDFKQVLLFEPENKAAKNRIVMCDKGRKECEIKQKRIFANMFKKMPNNSDDSDKKFEDLEISEWNTESAPAINADPNTLSVSGDIQMNLDLSQELSNTSVEGDSIRQG